MKLLPGLVLLATLCLFFTMLVVLGFPAAHAYDDSIDTNSSQSSGVNSTQLISLLNQLASQQNNTQGLPLSNDTQLQQLLSQLNASITSGNANQTASSLHQLQNFTSSSAVAPSVLSTLVNSLQATSNGVTVNPSELSSLLTTGANGLPNGLGPGSTKQQIGDLASLSGLLTSVNPQLAQQFLNLANDLSLNSGIPVPTGSSGLAGGGLNPLRGVQPPSVSPVKLPGSESISSDWELFAVPGIIALCTLTLFAARRRLGNLLRGQKNPGETEEAFEPMEYDPLNPKKRILYYYHQALEQTKKRGVPKAAAETHREFTGRYDGKPGSQHVRAIATLYEKAKFSGSAVTQEDAEAVRKELANLSVTETT